MRGNTANCDSCHRSKFVLTFKVVRFPNTHGSLNHMIYFVMWLTSQPTSLLNEHRYVCKVYFV
ncbi:hypothetical protein KM92CIT3_70104 [uncultured Citrobacter sp.]|uniref:Uncharacterized protein n=1 Tax=uncultured Citrobacter sp. TaxID=200446 RepID=A0A212II71_9ENTR|nr:hypothetical protein KL86CIT2_140003 [uncultured Citrobacter sp.]SBV66413.1 hypothetical protein KM92CIT3_70104 [uncultured Citrobacter sp.]